MFPKVFEPLKFESICNIAENASKPVIIIYDPVRRVFLAEDSFRPQNLLPVHSVSCACLSWTLVKICAWPSFPLGNEGWM